MTLRERLIPGHLLGRMTAGAGLVLAGLEPLGALAGSTLGQAVGPAGDSLHRVRGNAGRVIVAGALTSTGR